MSESRNEEIRALRECFWSERDPEGRVFAPLADACLRSGKVEEAERLVREGLGRHPGFATGHLVAARVARALGEVAKMREHTDRVIELDAGNALARIQRAAASAREGDSSAALADLRSAVAVAPGGVEGLSRLAVLEAVPEIGELIGTVVAGHTGKVGGEGPPGDGRSSREGDPAEAARGGGTGVPSVPAAASGTGPARSDEGPADVAFLENSFVTRTMGELYASQGLTERAAGVYEHLVRSDPGNAELSMRLDSLKTPPPVGAPPQPDAPAAGQVGESPAWEPGALPVEDPATAQGSGGGPVRTVGSEPATSPVPTTAPGRREADGVQAGGVDEFTRWLEGLTS